MNDTVKYAVLLARWLKEDGYTHCFFVAGGNIMHLLDAVRSCMTCVPFVHEVGATIAAEYFNESSGGKRGRAFALVTAGPGLTNAVTGIAGAWLESRELLVLGGQVKSVDLATGGIRQRGIQEIDGIALCESITVRSQRITAPIDKSSFLELVESGAMGRKGPVFIEVCLDAQAAPVLPAALEGSGVPVPAARKQPPAETIRAVLARVRDAQRPVLLLGGGVSRDAAHRLRSRLTAAGVAVMVTWNGADRMGDDDANYFGRPNTWGQRFSNILLQQADVLVALGSRLGMQQTGFNHQAFAPLAHVVQVDIDPAELQKGHPRVDTPIEADADAVLEALLQHDLGEHTEWLAFCRGVRERLPVSDAGNEHAPGYLDPFDFNVAIGQRCSADDIVIPCSSGGAFTTAMQAFAQKYGQIIVTNKGLASMGYGLSGAIGAALAYPQRRVVLFEGDGGFTQNLQELATASVNGAWLKIFIFSNEGYASIRMTQKNYFGGEYLGCDVRTGLGFPQWDRLFSAYDIPCLTLNSIDGGAEFHRLFAAPGPAAFVVPIDPEQSYYPKITSRMTATGGMESNPLHLMTPDLDPATMADVLPHLVPAPVAAR